MSDPDARDLTPEASDLLRALDSQRQHILGAFEGLPEEAFHRALLPSGWTCAGLVQHLAYDVEHFWYCLVVSGGAPDDHVAEEPENAWHVVPGTSAQAILDLYRAEAARADEVIRTTPMDTPPAWWPDFFGSWRLDNLRQIIVHTITETATHAGHLDAARELIDGKTWLILT